MDSWSPDIYLRTYKFAAQAHWNRKLQQLVPGTDIPYLMHISLVAMEVIAALGKSSDLDGNLAVQCALLHDTIEDTATTYEQLVDNFGLAVADGVQALSKDQSIGVKLPKQQRKKLQMTDSLERIKQQPREVWMVKMADRITNLQPPPSHWNRDKINGYLEEAGEIYEALKDGNQYLANRLQEKIEAYGNRAVNGAISAIRNCALTMLDNASYIQRELPNVEMNEALRSQTAELCESMVGTKHEVSSEIFEINKLLKLKTNLAVVSSRIERLIRWLSENIIKMHQLVLALREDSQKNQNHTLSLLLVQESATNIVNAFNSAKSMVDALMVEKSEKGARC